MKEQPPKKPPIKTAMRLPAELHADLKEAAEREDHSMNDEIILRCTAMQGGASLAAILAETKHLRDENRQLKAEIKKTQQMVQAILDAMGPNRKR